MNALKEDCDGHKCTTSQLDVGVAMGKNKVDNTFQEVKKWSSQLKLELKFNISQAHDLLELKERVDLMLKNISPQLEIAQENLYTREQLKGADKIKDTVEEFLLREIDTLRRSEETLLDDLEKLNNQLHDLRAARNDIEIDIAQKTNAEKSDECARLLQSLGDETVVVPQQTVSQSSSAMWLTTTKSLIQKSQEERTSTHRTFTSVTNEMVKVADECFSAWYETNSAFQKRIKKIAQFKETLEEQLDKTKADIKGLQCQNGKLEILLNEKTKQYQAAQTRLEKKRGENKNFELCRDPILIGILQDIHSLKKSVDNLTGKHEKLQESLRDSLKAKSSLEHDLKFKNVALRIDREKCLNLRQINPISTFKDSRFPKESGPTGELYVPITR